ncbi:MAG: type II toxin-antitoxin system VapC family toxin [Fibromonadaceae bacterium]|nr:type II toxin-antitoxin system VapC family toxin [Fibromonadaceae bacterium]
MIIDTDVLVWFYRGYETAKKTILNAIPFKVSAITYLELLEGIRNKEELSKLKNDFSEWGVEILQMNESISLKAISLVEKYKLSHNLELADSLIAATVLENNETLLTGNIKHYSYIKNLNVNKFENLF